MIRDFSCVPAPWNKLTRGGLSCLLKGNVPSNTAPFDRPCNLEIGFLNPVLPRADTRVENVRPAAL